MKRDANHPIRVLVVGENVSMRMGGEASLPFYYFKLMRARGIDVHVACHQRVREEIEETFGAEASERFHFVHDTVLQRWLWRVGRLFPLRIKDLFFGQAIHALTQRKIRSVARRLVREDRIDIVLEPSPITPKGASFMYRLGVPVVIGPLCGGLSFPPAFRHMDSIWVRKLVGVGRVFSALVHRLVPGKREADVLLVANCTAKKALPRGCRGRVIEVVESGVDLTIWKPKPQGVGTDGPLRFVYAGRFVDWKGVGYLLKAFARLPREAGVRLDLIGGGDLDQSLRREVAELNLEQKVYFHGWLPRTQSAQIMQSCDVFVMPSLRECGGTAILEAMAMGLPVVATNWAGPSHYVTESCGILVDPSGEEAFVEGLAGAMLRLAEDPALRKSMAEAGPRHVRTNYYDWDSKTDRVLDILHQTVAART
ncbi:MAG: glycosyltransferase family 4 protein [Phycisphaeraceae bacterium]|nr:glycosyltransferase family 4 protein [Phycisphaeraceae bacterium]